MQKGVLVKYTNQIVRLFCFLFVFPTLSLAAREEADYVVIGVGTAGATITRLLSDDPNTSVIAIHNGRNLTQDPEVKFTKNAAFVLASVGFGAPLFQTGFSLPQPSIDDREVFWAQGLPEGGTSSVNAGAWARGTDQVYAQWEAIAGPEWSTTQILDIYKSLEKYQGSTPNPSARGFNGPVNVRQVPFPTPFAVKFTEAVAAATGTPVVIDYNNPDTPIGASSQMQYTQKGANGRLRVSSAVAFLGDNVVTPDGEGVGDRRLTIKFKSTALRTIWEGNKAVGVEYFKDGKIRKAYANKGVIVCAGLYSSVFLMHSGVGPRVVLEPLGIDVKYDNPNVGKALADQTILLTLFSTNPADTPVSPGNSSSDASFPKNISISALDNSFIFNIPNLPNTNYREQLLNAVFCDGFKFPGNSIFSQIAWLPAPGGDPNIRKVRITTVNPFPGLAVAMVDLVQPLSRGKITINSFNPFDPPVISNAGILNNPNDLALYVQTFQTYIKNINATLHAMDANYELIFPDPAIIDDVDLLTAYIKEVVVSSQCWQSHCRMAPLGQGGVVNNRGKVHGVQNLYVADDSIVPVAMDGTPMASAYLIAANIARLLLE